MFTTRKRVERVIIICRFGLVCFIERVERMLIISDVDPTLDKEVDES